MYESYFVTWYSYDNLSYLRNIEFRVRFSITKFEFLAKLTRDQHLEQNYLLLYSSRLAMMHVQLNLQDA